MTKKVPTVQVSDSALGLEPHGPNASLAVPFPRWKRARDRACAAVLAGEKRVLITGPPGTGKTVLVQEIARILRYAGWDASVRVAGMDKGDTDASIGPQAVLLIDEADRLDDAELQSLAGSYSGSVVLAGLDSIGLRWEAGVRISLTPLGRTDATAYVAQWLATAGHAPDHLDEAAVQRVIELASGIPRLLSSLLGAATWLSQTAGADHVAVRQVDDAAALRSCLLEGEQEPEPRPPAAETALPPPAQPKPVVAADEPIPLAHQAPEVPPAEPVAPILPEPAAVPARRRRVLIPVLAGIAAFAVAAGGASVYRWPSETAQATQLLRARIAHYMQLTGLTEPAAVAQHAPVVAPSAYLASVSPPQQADLPAAFQPVRLPVEPAVSRPRIEPPPEPPPLALAKAAPEGEVKAPEIIEQPPEPPRQSAEPPEHSPAPIERTAALAPDPTPDPAPVIPAQVAAPLPELPPLVQQAAASVPLVAVSRPAAAPPPPPQQASAMPLPPALIETLLRRGNEMLALGDLSAARLLFGRAAQAGHSGAMLALGRTYDPDSANAAGPSQPGDPAVAADWYRRAAAAGSTEAAALLRQIELHAAK